MKVTLERNHLLKSLGHVHRVVERRNTYPILANVLIKAGDDGLDLRATDLDIEVTESVPAMVGDARAPPRFPPTRSTKSCASSPMARRSGSRPRAASRWPLTSGRSRFHLACLVARRLPGPQVGHLLPQLLACRPPLCAS